MFIQDELGGGETMETGEEPETGQEMAVVLHEVSQLVVYVYKFDL